jgi:response regulator of citrate/malate metabolism
MKPNDPLKAAFEQVNHMNTEGLNLFIIDDDPFTVAALGNYLKKKFGNILRISTFNEGEAALRKIDKDTDIVILDYYLKDSKGTDVLSEIKTINPKTKVIMLSNNEEVGVAIESFRRGASDYVLKGEKALKKISMRVNKIVMYPIYLMVNKFSINKYLAIFFMTFMTIGIVVLIALGVYYNSGRPH